MGRLWGFLGLQWNRLRAVATRQPPPHQGAGNGQAQNNNDRGGEGGAANVLQVKNL